MKEEGIDYDKVFALVARMEAIRLFLAFASFMGFIVYQMDVKSTFLYDTIDEEVYVSQPPGFVDPDHPKKYFGSTKSLGVMSLDGLMRKANFDEFYGVNCENCNNPIETKVALPKDVEAVEWCLVTEKVSLKGRHLDLFVKVFVCGSVRVQQLWCSFSDGLAAEWLHNYVRHWKMLLVGVQVLILVDVTRVWIVILYVDYGIKSARLMVNSASFVRYGTTRTRLDLEQ
ncbi:copia protein [Tanacetum coccineum]|uniref:Copia protein n=1 Tax=Tanacetum coccineum TaxID=301880 RepID=A0ABQ4YAD5_9ASTR